MWDVFETDGYEKVRMFVLLAQPCDIALRPKGKSRSRDTAFLVPLTKLSDPVEAKNKDFVLPCKLEGRYWECDFARTSTVRLVILDLASFREDGRVRVDFDHAAPKNLFPSQNRIYEKSTATASIAMGDRTYVDDKGQSTHLSLQLAFTWGRRLQTILVRPTVQRPKPIRKPISQPCPSVSHGDWLGRGVCECRMP